MGKANSKSDKAKHAEGWTNVAMAIGFLMVGVLLIGSLFLLARIDLTELTDSKDQSKVIAAVIALVGVLATAMITLVGLLIKVSLDRNARMTQQAEQDRLRVDVAIKALGLMATSSGGQSTQTQQSGAVFTLAILGQLELALAMVRAIWPDDRIHSSTAILIIEKGLQSDSVQLQVKSANLLYENPTRLIATSGDILWPESILYLWKGLHESTRAHALETLALVLLCRKLEDWDIGYVRLVAYYLQGIIQEESEDDIKAAAAVISYIVVSILVGADEWGINSYKGDLFIFKEFLEECLLIIDERGRGSWGDDRLIDQLETWSSIAVEPLYEATKADKGAPVEEAPAEQTKQ